MLSLLSAKYPVTVEVDDSMGAGSGDRRAAARRYHRLGGERPTYIYVTEWVLRVSSQYIPGSHILGTEACRLVCREGRGSGILSAPFACLRLTTIVKSVPCRRTVLLYCATVPDSSVPRQLSQFPIAPCHNIGVNSEKTPRLTLPPEAGQTDR